MHIALIVLFVVGYLAIVLEHAVRINKAATALACGVGCWIVLFLNADSATAAHSALMLHFVDIAALLFFLLGAMTIVEVVDRHHGFDLVSEIIRSSTLPRVLVLVSVLTFFLSALLDNLTTSIVMCTLCQKLIVDRETRWSFASIIIISANAGGVWSPVGDVTTTMLWMGGQISAHAIIIDTIVPSLVVALVPTLIVARRLRGQTLELTTVEPLPRSSESVLILFCSLALFVAVPVFSALSHMPPFMAMLLALGMLWIITTLIHQNKEESLKVKYSVADALQSIDTPTILFFVGILLAVSALESSGVLTNLARSLDAAIANPFATAMFLGVLSAIVDNIPLIAATQGMYPLTHFACDHPFWSFLALTTGTGGSMMIIGSASGVAVMGMENITVSWHARRFFGLSALAFCCGCGVFLLLHLL